MAARQGERHHFAVLTEKQVIKLRKQPDNRNHIHRCCMKVNSSTVYSARCGRTWAYLNRTARPVRTR